MDWITITPDDVRKVLNAQELSALSDDASDILVDMIGDIIQTVREAIANNKGNTIEDQGTIPRSLRREALALLRMDIIMRYDLSVSETDARPRAAAQATAKLKDIATGAWQIINDDATVRTMPSARPAIVAPRPAMGNDGVGMYPTPYPRHNNN